MKPRILITAGDPLGIGPEITVKTLRSGAAAGLEITVIGDAAALAKAGFRRGLAALIPCDCPGLDLRRRAPGAAAGAASFKAVKLAAKLIGEGRYDALLTAPVSKEAWDLAGIPYAGHTEFFRTLTKKELLMGFTSGRAVAALVTEHISIRRLPAEITDAAVRVKARLFSEALGRTGIKRPRIILAALNPHSGDGGLLGREETAVLLPAVRRLRDDGLAITGPLPSDAAWRAQLSGKSDGLLCLYHDQALVPLKILPGAAGTVHWTWGLPFPRTSPAHGTAFDIAGRNKADPQSMKAALAFAAKWTKGNYEG